VENLKQSRAGLFAVPLVASCWEIRRRLANKAQMRMSGGMLQAIALKRGFPCTASELSRPHLSSPTLAYWPKRPPIRGGAAKGQHSFTRAILALKLSMRCWPTKCSSGPLLAT
jgi:hypothetical protein